MINDYLILNIYIKEKIDFKNAIIHIHRELYIINDLKIKILLKMNIIIFKRIIIDINVKIFRINNYKNFIIDFNIIIKNNKRIRKILKIEKKIIIEINTIIKVFINFFKKLFNRDYLFVLNFLTFTFT